MNKVKKIPTCDIPDGYYAYHWSREGEILRDKINEIIDAAGLAQQEEQVFTIERKNGEFDFAISSAIEDMSLEEFNQLREMLIVAIGAMEQMHNYNPHPCDCWEEE